MPLTYAPHIGQRALALHRYLVRIAGALVMTFLWIYVFAYFLSTRFSLGDALAHTLFLYALSEIVTLLATPIALRYISGSMLRGLTFGTAFLALAYCYSALFVAGLFPHGAAAIGILFGISRALYRVPYTMESQQFNRGSNMFVLREISLALMPLVAGSLLAFRFPFASLMLIVALLGLIAIAFLPLVPNVHERFSWRYHETMRQFLRERNAPLVYRGALSGALSVALIILLPLILILLGVRTPGLLGAYISAMLIITIMIGSGRGAFGILERDVDGGHYVDEYTALKEMGRALGGAVVCAALAAIAALS